LFNVRRLITMLRACFQSKKIQVVVYTFATVCLILFTAECWLNFQVRSHLRQSLGWGIGPEVKIAAHLNWLSIHDVMQGRVGWVKIDAENCLISNLHFARLHLQNDGFSFDLPLLFKEQRLKLIHVNKTRIWAKVTATALSEFLTLHYPQFKPVVQINPDRLIVSGETQLFGNVVPAMLSGTVKIASLKNLRFYPTGLLVYGHTVPPNFLRFISTQVPLEFTLMADWPLSVTAVSLKAGYLALDFKEINQPRSLPGD
jgi:hypothetical protein